MGLTDRMRKAHLHYLKTLVFYYDKKFEAVAKKFRKFGENGEKATDDCDKARWEKFVQERKHFKEGSGYACLKDLIEQEDISEESNSDKLYKLIEVRQKTLEQTIKNIKSL